MGKLYEVLAVEADKKGIAIRLLDESLKVFKNNTKLFEGFSKKLSMDAAGQESIELANSETSELSTTVQERLDYTVPAVSDWLDITLQKEATNQTAVADLMIDGEILAKDLPATFLLGLEDKLKKIRSVYEAIPTLDSSVVWEKNVNGKTNTFRARDTEIKTKTQKQPKSRILYEATENHPAQIERWNEEVVIGRYITNLTSGKISSERKMTLLGRIDRLIQAVKQARMRANGVKVVIKNIGNDLFEFINK